MVAWTFKVGRSLVLVIAAYAAALGADPFSDPEFVRSLLDGQRRDEMRDAARAKDIRSLIDDLKHGDFQRRDVAAEELAKRGPTAVQPLTECLKDADWHVRSSAVTLLGKFKDAGVTPLLMDRLLDNDSDVRKAAADSLGILGDARVVPRLIDRLKDEDSGVRAAAARALGALADSRAVEPLITCLKETNHGIASSAAGWALSRLGRSAVEPLIACLNDRNVSGTAAKALGDLGDARAVEPLIARLNDHNVGPTAAEALGKLGDTRAVEPLIACLNDSKLPNRNTFSPHGWPNRDVAVAALVKLHDARVIPALIDFLNDNDPHVRSAAAEALGRLGAKRAVLSLSDCLNDDICEVRSTAAKALGTLADARAIPPLVAALPDWDVSPTIGDALKKLGWKPTCDEERVRFWISQKDRKSLTQDWKTTKRVLLSDARSGEERKVETAVLTFIALGSNEVVPDLARLLSASGTKNLALIYLNSGNGGLRAAADDWASQHGYEVMTIPGRASGPAWGSW